MSDQTGIEWTDATWNPVTGCTKISPGCKNCYAERLAQRLKAIGVPQYADGFNLTLQPEALLLPARWKRARMIFVNSMSDLFHAEIPIDYIKRVFDVMSRSPQHVFQVLTKRPEIAATYSKHLAWTDNIWMGTSIESDAYLSRLDSLRSIPAKVRFLSLEPLLGPMPDISLEGVDWVIVGGESGPRARPMEITWVRQIRDRCLAARVPFFFKQWGGVNKKATGRVIDRKVWNQFPPAAAPGSTRAVATATPSASPPSMGDDRYEQPIEWQPE